jgi:hypothetical protein
MGFPTRLCLTAAVLTGSLHVALAQSPLDLRQLHTGSTTDPAPTYSSETTKHQALGDMAMMDDDKMGSKPTGGMPMSDDDKMGSKPAGAMPMNDDKMGGKTGQGSPTMGASTGMERMMPMMAMGMPAMPGRSGNLLWATDHVEGRIAFLQAELAITDTQMAQWHGLADAMRSAAKSVLATIAAQPPGRPVTAPDRGDREIQLLSARLESMRAVHSAEVTLYAVLSDNQKKVINELIAGPIGPL